MNINFQHELNQHLNPNEHFIWLGSPKQGFMFNTIDMLLIPFSLMWGGFAIFWEFSVITEDMPLIFKLWGIPFVLIGLYLIVGRFFYDAKRREKIIYGLTKQRIIIKSGIFRPSIKSLHIKTLSDISLNENGDGRGTVTLGAENYFAGMIRGTGWMMTNGKAAPALETIEEAKSVYQQIINLQLEQQWD